MPSVDRCVRLRMKHLVPLIAFLVSTIMGSVMIWPAAAVTAKHIGSFAWMLLWVAGTYFFGLHLVLEDCRRATRDIGRADPPDHAGDHEPLPG